MFAFVSFGAQARLLQGPTVHVRGDVYQVTATFTVHASVQRVFGILTDYRQTRRLNPDVVNSRVVGTPTPGHTRVRLRIRSCLLFFCFHVHQTEDMTAVTDRSIHGVIVPQLSSFRSGYADWRLQPQGAHHTKLAFVTAIVPRFYIPPFIGPWLLRRKLSDEIRTTARRLTALAQSSQPPTAGP
ncbi:MAG: SRPBCC family protein [Acidiferrobacter sp.]